MVLLNIFSFYYPLCEVQIEMTYGWVKATNYFFLNKSHLPCLLSIALSLGSIRQAKNYLTIADKCCIFSAILFQNGTGRGQLL